MRDCVNSGVERTTTHAGATASFDGSCAPDCKQLCLSKRFQEAFSAIRCCNRFLSQFSLPNRQKGQVLPERPSPKRRRARMDSAPTLADVGRAAGVSTATVSRAIARPELVSGETRD